MLYDVHKLLNDKNGILADNNYNPDCACYNINLKTEYLRCDMANVSELK